MVPGAAKVASTHACQSKWSCLPGWGQFKNQPRFTGRSGLKWLSGNVLRSKTTYMILQFITHWMALYLYTQNITRCIKGSFSFSGHNKKHLSQTVWQSHNFINYLMELDVCFIFLTGDIMPYDYQQLLMTLIKVSLTAFPVFMKLSHWNDMRGNLILCDKLVFESWSLKMSLGKLSLQCIS